MLSQVHSVCEFVPLGPNYEYEKTLNGVINVIISRYQSGVDEDLSPMECNVMSSGKWLPTFRRSIVVSSSA
jgi:hypothetical protein